MYKQGLRRGGGRSKGKNEYTWEHQQSITEGMNLNSVLKKEQEIGKYGGKESIVPSCRGLVKDDIIRPVVYLPFVGIGS